MKYDKWVDPAPSAFDKWNNAPEQNWTLNGESIHAMRAAWNAALEAAAKLCEESQGHFDRVIGPGPTAGYIRALKEPT